MRVVEFLQNDKLSAITCMRDDLFGDVRLILKCATLVGVLNQGNVDRVAHRVNL
jgi:hypothetical protein